MTTYLPFHMVYIHADPMVLSTACLMVKRDPSFLFQLQEKLVGSSPWVKILNPLGLSGLLLLLLWASRGGGLDRISVCCPEFLGRMARIKMRQAKSTDIYLPLAVVQKNKLDLNMVEHPLYTQKGPWGILNEHEALRMLIPSPPPTRLP